MSAAPAAGGEGVVSAAAKNAVEFAAGGVAVDGESPSLKVIADHIRACTFTVVDGVIPGNEGRGYVLRRIARRAIRHGYKLGQKTPFFHKLVRDLVIQMGAAYPRLSEQETAITEVLRAEEERFFETLEHGMHILDAALADGVKLLAGDIAFKHLMFQLATEKIDNGLKAREFTEDQVHRFRAWMAQDRARLGPASGAEPTRDA